MSKTSHLHFLKLKISSPNFLERATKTKNFQLGKFLSNLFRARVINQPNPPPPPPNCCGGDKTQGSITIMLTSFALKSHRVAISLGSLKSHRVAISRELLEITSRCYFIVIYSPPKNCCGGIRQGSNTIMSSLALKFVSNKTIDVEIILSITLTVS